jgi:folate-dependent phosphoribosylglycinamide formyltransferase PurN
MASEGSVVLLAGPGPSSWIVYNALAADFPDTVVVLEEGFSRLQLLRRRIRKLGCRAALGQLLFVGLVVPLLSARGRRRIKSIKCTFGLDDTPAWHVTHRVPSVNSDEARRVLAESRPGVLVVNGTRIIARETLQSVQATFINMHAGITPLYRGVHGGYWALAEGRPDLVGTTIHRVDLGIDTGNVLRQVFFEIGKEDNFATYPYLHLAHGIPALVDVIKAELNGVPMGQSKSMQISSRLRHHPTLWQYVRYRLSSGIR